MLLVAVCVVEPLKWKREEKRKGLALNAQHKHKHTQLISTRSSRLLEIA
jgi:hypothetical protein